MHKKIISRESLIYWFPILFILIIQLIIKPINKEFYKALTGHEGYLEHVQALAFFVAAILGFLAWLKLKNLKEFGQISKLLLMFGLGCLLITYEELSWLTTLINNDSLSSVKALSTQSEVNIHNLKIVHFNNSHDYIYIYRPNWILGASIKKE